MESVSHVIKVSVPNYFAELPIPNSIGGWFKLGVRDWLSLVPLGAAVAGLTYMSYRAFCPVSRGSCGAKKGDRRVNRSIKKNIDKVVDSLDVEDIGDKAAFCRCWRSKKFPYCDGAHNAHNTETGDNVGPMCVQVKTK